jgi:hypothetical protein
MHDRMSRFVRQREALTVPWRVCVYEDYWPTIRRPIAERIQSPPTQVDRHHDNPGGLERCYEIRDGTRLYSQGQADLLGDVLRAHVLVWCGAQSGQLRIGHTSQIQQSRRVLT